MNASYRIGVFDSGVGGLDVLFRLKRLMPHEAITYFADTVNHPYGEKSPEDVARFLGEIVEGMLLRRVKLLVIACNTASVVFQRLPESHPLKARLREAGVDVIPMTSGVALGELVSLRPARVLLTGTRLTMQSGIYQALLAETCPEAEVRTLAAPAWVEAVEHPLADRGANHERRAHVIREAIAALGGYEPDAVFLGCTHFPELAPELSAAFGPGAHLVNPAQALALFVRHYLDVRGLAATRGETPPDVVFTNGAAARIRETLERQGYAGRVEIREIDIRNDFSGKQVDIVGYGVTGQSLLRFLAGKGTARLTVRDSRPLKAAELRALAQDPALCVVSGEGYLDGLGEADIILRSPGVPADLPAFVEARRAGVPVMGDIDLFLRDAPGRKVAISGTNGKTTTTLLTRRLFAEEIGDDARVVGNVGRPVLDDLASLGARSVTAIELSSFQLEELSALPVQAAILLNITPDHLDRHGGMLGYILAKGQLLRLLNESAFAIYNIDSEPIVNVLLPRGCRARMVPFSRLRELERGAFFAGDDLVFRMEGRDELRLPGYRRTRLFRGEHNMENVMAAGLAAYLLGVSEAAITRVLTSFAGVRYRIEPVAALRGVRFFDDAKGTNPDATIKAIEALTEPIRLVAGGINKGFVFDEVARAAAGRVRKAYLFGEVADALRQSFEALPDPIECVTVPELEDATRLAAAEAGAGEAVLFSPACASPKGQKYVQRGDRFKATVRALGFDEAAPFGVDALVLEDPLAH